MNDKKAFERFAWQYKNETNYEEELDEEGLDPEEVEKIYFGEEE